MPFPHHLLCDGDFDCPRCSRVCCTFRSEWLRDGGSGFQAVMCLRCGAMWKIKTAPAAKVSVDRGPT